MALVQAPKGARPEAAAAQVEGLTQRSLVLVTADAGVREYLRQTLTGMRWRVSEASGGAEAMARIDELRPEALLMDNWLPDLEAVEFASHIQRMYPAMELLRIDGGAESTEAKSPRRHELLQALRQAQGFSAGGTEVPTKDLLPFNPMSEATESKRVNERTASAGVERPNPAQSSGAAPQAATAPRELLPEMIGASAPMLELAEMIRLVAPRSTTVLIEGETGTGKEVVAKALHRLSARSQKAFSVLNCAAIPEALLEAELFGHTRGAFTGAIQSRMGRIEAANGGTLFLDEIGEMPVVLQSKMLRFLECGELQRVGDNEVMRVDVRVIAATHQPLERRSEEGAFRLDLYHRLAVFPIEVPPLRDRMGDLPLLSEHILKGLGKDSPRKRITPEALERLAEHRWPGNVRELMHVLERAVIFAADRPEIGPEDIRIRRKERA